jgi:hypothetical protein
MESCNINTATAGTTTYTFTSTDASQCATSASISVTVTPQVIPTFNAIGPLCQNSTAPLLPGTSVNGITGYGVLQLLIQHCRYYYLYIYIN